MDFVLNQYAIDLSYKMFIFDLLVAISVELTSMTFSVRGFGIMGHHFSSSLCSWFLEFCSISSYVSRYDYWLRNEALK